MINQTPDIKPAAKPVSKPNPNNPLFDEPEGIESDTFTGEQVQVAGLLGKAFMQPLKQVMEETPNVVIKAKATEMGEDAMLRRDEFLERHQLPDYEAPDKVENINLKYLEAPEQVNRVIDDIAGMMPEQVVSPRTGLPGRVDILTAEEVGLYIHLLDADFPILNFIVQPLMRRVESAGMANHAG